jgi:hypothetical protein
LKGEILKMEKIWECEQMGVNIPSYTKGEKEEEPSFFSKIGKPDGTPVTSEKEKQFETHIKRRKKKVLNKPRYDKRSRRVKYPNAGLYDGMTAELKPSLKGNLRKKCRMSISLLRDHIRAGRARLARFTGSSTTHTARPATQHMEHHTAAATGESSGGGGASGGTDSGGGASDSRPSGDSARFYFQQLFVTIPFCTQNNSFFTP